MADYCTLAEVKTLIPEAGLNASADYDGALSTLITAASRAIDQEVGKWNNYFYPTTDDVTRYYNGNGSTELWIDEFVSITSVSVSETGGLASTDYTLWSSSDYITWPYNTTPIMALVIDVNNGSKLYFDAYPKSVKVVGVSGYSTTPPTIVNLACIEQTILWWMESKQGYMESGANSELGQVIVNLNARRKYGQQLNADVANKLTKYKVSAAGGAGY